MFFNGCRVADLVNECRSAPRFDKCVKDVAKALRKAGVITKSQEKSLEDCAG